MRTRSGKGYSDKLSSEDGNVTQEPVASAQKKEHNTNIRKRVQIKVRDKKCSRCESLIVDLQKKQDDLEKGKIAKEDAERIISRLNDQIQAVQKELDIERSWRKSNEKKVHSLMDKIPPYAEKSEPTKVDFAETNSVTEHQEEVKVLTAKASSLLEENTDLKKALDAQRSVFGDFRLWMESGKCESNMRFEEFNDAEVEEVLKESKMIGSGGYGKVYKASLAGTMVAIKLLDHTSDQGLREYNAEVNILRNLHHQNLVHLIGACPTKKALVYEYLENGTLEQHLSDQDKGMTWQKRIDTAVDLCSALIFLHNIRPKPVVHGDLKPENILFDMDDNMKLCDFGISYQLVDVTATGTWHHITGGTPRGTSGYIDPEFQATGKLTPLADEYAFGVILLQLATGQGPSGLAKFVEGKLKSYAVLKNKPLPTQRKIMIKMGLADERLGKEGWDPQAVVLLLQLGLACTNPEGKTRPSLEGSVWPQLYMLRQESDFC